MSAGPPLRLTPGLSRILKIAVAAGLTAYVLWRADVPQVGRALSRADWTWLTLAVALVVADRVLMAWRWIALLDQRAGALPRTWRLLHIFFVSSFLGVFLPAGVGSDAVRAWSLSRENVAGSRALASVMMDRLLGIIAVVLLAALGLLTAGPLVPVAVLAAAVATAGLACAAAAALIYSSRVEGGLQALTRRLPERFIQPCSRLLAAMRAYSTRHRPLILVLILSIAVNVLRIVQAYLLGRSLALDAPWFAYAAFVPIIVLIMQLPVTILGLGTTQAAFLLFFRQVGTSQADAVALSVLFLGLGLVGLLPGGFLYLFNTPRQPSPHRGVL